MSDREWRFYLNDMAEFAGRVITYSEGMTQEDFESNNLNFDAIARNIELIGEAATRIPEEIRTSNQDISWRQIIATRNQLIHGYLGIDNDVLWSIVQDDIPLLLQQLQSLIKKSS